MSGGDVAKVAIPMAATIASGGVLAPALIPSLGAVAAPIVAGAVGGAAGSAITGGDPLTGAALGGIGGGVTGGSFGNVFGSGSDAAVSGIGQAGGDVVASGSMAGLPVGQAVDTAALGGITPGAETFSAATDIGTLNASFDPSAPLAANSPAGIGSVGAPEIGAYQPNAALSFGEAAPLASAPQNSAAFAAPDLTAGIGNTSTLATDVPLSATDKMLSFAKNNPMSVIGSGIGGYMMAGGDEQAEPLARDERKINNVAPLKREQLSIDPNAFYGIGGARSGYVKANPNTVYLAHGGSVAPRGISSMVRGGGDGQSDTIPAMLSDGEYVIPAPVVSALGRGSNDAGAKKLDKMKKHIMAKTYKGGKPPAAGLGAMRVA